MAIKDHPKFNTLNTWTKSMINTIKARQAQHFSKRGRYFQGLKTPTEICDGETSKDIAYGRRPADQSESWADFAPRSFKEGVKFPARTRVNVYESPEGWGYTIRFEIQREGLGPDTYGVDGDLWVYQHNEGPEEKSGVWDEWYIEELIEEP